MKKTLGILSIFFSTCVSFNAFSSLEESNLEHSTIHQNIISSESETLIKNIKEMFADGISISDITNAYQMIDAVMQHNPDMTVEEKRAFATNIICKISDMIHIPYMPEIIVDSVVEICAPILSMLMYPENGSLQCLDSIKGIPHELEIRKAIDGFIDDLSDGITLEEIPTCFMFASSFAISCKDLDSHNRGNVAKFIISELLDKTDTPFLPDFFSDAVFKTLGFSMIDYFIAKGDI
ncbi:MAG: hypothetical protein FJZ57_02340 [Chlamydiae bacterium]|nr:hypothetical protein [Chlamydiota bacterium]